MYRLKFSFVRCKVKKYFFIIDCLEMKTVSFLSADLLMKESSGRQFSPPAKRLEMGVKSRYLRENGLEHIEVHSLVSGDVLDLDV